MTKQKAVDSSDAEIKRDALERIADALESLAAPLDVEPAPPRCPHCGDIFPVIQTEDSEGAGPITTFVIRGHCKNCGRVMYAVSNHWVLHPTFEQAETHVKALQEGMIEYGNG